MILKVHRIVADGSSVESYIKSSNIRAVEISERDGATTIIRTDNGCMAVTEEFDVMTKTWADACGEKIMGEDE